jgi:hypothetical protein
LSHPLGLQLLQVALATGFVPEYLVGNSGAEKQYEDI